VDDLYRYGSFLERAIAYLIDVLIRAILAMICLFIILFPFYYSSSNSDLFLQSPEFRLAITLIFVIASWLYYAILESSSKQATLGKQIIGLKVTDLNLQPISFAKSSARYWSRSIIGLGLIFVQIPFIRLIPLWCLVYFFTEKKQCLHDLIARCIVVKAKV